AAGGRDDSLETEMLGSPLAPERRAPQSAVRELKRDAAYVEAVVALVLVLSIVTLVYLLSLDVT
ncbi:MAG: hypothetical protein WD207_02940, partial [Xanthobacteraceae bacterium]